MFIDVGRVRMLALGVPHTSVLRVGVLEWLDADRTQAILRTGPSPFLDVLLLPSVATSGNGAGP
jgi:hypothetical protein